MVSVSIGSIVRIALDLDAKLHNFGSYLQGKYKSKNPMFFKGFITDVMVQCVGALAILGPLNASLATTHLY